MIYQLIQITNRAIKLNSMSPELSNAKVTKHHNANSENLQIQMSTGPAPVHAKSMIIKNKLKKGKEEKNSLQIKRVHSLHPHQEQRWASSQWVRSWHAFQGQSLPRYRVPRTHP
jgi:hypothetical protein